MASNGNYAVNGVRYRQAARLDATGQPFTSTLVTFMVGPHGPFTLMFAPGQATPDNVANAITATVNQIISGDQKIAALNQGTSA